MKRCIEMENINQKLIALAYDKQQISVEDMDGTMYNGHGSYND